MNYILTIETEESFRTLTDKFDTQAQAVEWLKEVSERYQDKSFTNILLEDNENKAVAFFTTTPGHDNTGQVKVY